MEGERGSDQWAYDRNFFLIKLLCLHLVEMQQFIVNQFSQRKMTQQRGHTQHGILSHFGTLPNEHPIITAFPDPEQVVSLSFSYFHFY